MTISLYRLYGTRKYNKYFNELFGMIYSQLKSGATLSGIAGIEDKSWITKLVLFILGKLADTGGGTPLTLEHLTRFVSDVTTIKKSTVSALRMQMLLVYIGPIIMVFVSKTSISLLTKMSSNLSFFSNLGVGGAFAITPEFVDAINIVIVISSLAMGFVFTKISMFTLKDTKNVAITAIIVIIAILISPYLPSIF
jgi:flagellar protein FlaJ